MANEPYDVVEVVTMQLIGSDASVLPIITELSFRRGDPYTVRAVFTGSESMSTWLIGRELLAQGLDAGIDAPAGLGDVQVWRDDEPEFVLLSLTGVEGNALLAASAESLQRFLDATARLVPLGAEGASMDGVLSAFITALLTA